MILFVRQVYPEESFCSPKSTLFGLRLHQNRHPVVASYISDAIEVALPSLASRVADSIALTITEIPLAGAISAEEDPRRRAHPQEMMDTDVEDAYHGFKQQSKDQDRLEIIQAEPVVLEKFELRFPQQMHDKMSVQLSEVSDNSDNNNNNNENTVYTRSAIEYLEREMRAILLSVLAMKDTDDHGAARSADDSRSFTISLHIPEVNATCESLNRAMASGQWRTPPTATYLNRTRDRIPYVIRPIHEMDALTSPVGPVQFLVKYPRPVVSRRVKRTGVPSGTSPEEKSSGTQSTPTLDF